MNQPDDSGPQQMPDAFDPRHQRGESRAVMTDPRRPGDAADYQARNARGTDFPQQVYRNERSALNRQHREPANDDHEEAARSMAAHPLFRGLLQELPPRTAPPSQEWLDRWSATARSILELLYSRDPLA